MLWRLLPVGRCESLLPVTNEWWWWRGMLTVVWDVVEEVIFRESGMVVAVTGNISPVGGR